MDPRKYKESAIIGNKVEVLFSALRRPADKIIPALDMARGGRESKAGNRSLIEKDHIFEVFSRGLRNHATGHWLESSSRLDKVSETEPCGS